VAYIIYIDKWVTIVYLSAIIYNTWRLNDKYAGRVVMSIGKKKTFDIIPDHEKSILYK